MNPNLTNKNNEIWLPCVGYENKYTVSNYGRVKSLPYTYTYPNTNKKRFYKEKIKKQCETSKRDNSQGYLCTRLIDENGNSTAALVHILVARAFIPNPFNLPTVNHKDGNKHNNCVENLEWASYSDNNQHAYNNNLKTDNQILIRTKNNVIEDIFISENDAFIKTKITPIRIRRLINNGMSDDYGYLWYKFMPGCFLIQSIK